MLVAFPEREDVIWIAIETINARVVRRASVEIVAEHEAMLEHPTLPP